MTNSHHLVPSGNEGRTQAVDEIDFAVTSSRDRHTATYLTSHFNSDQKSDLQGSTCPKGYVNSIVPRRSLKPLSSFMLVRLYVDGCPAPQLLLGWFPYPVFSTIRLLGQPGFWLSRFQVVGVAYAQATSPLDSGAPFRIFILCNSPALSPRYVLRRLEGARGCTGTCLSWSLITFGDRQTVPASIQALSMNTGSFA